MRRLHLWIGIAGVVAFALTGQYMDRWLSHLAGMADLPRMLYRSSHIYLLLASLLNLMLGLYLTENPAGWRLWVRHAGSVGIAVAPAVLLLAFAQEAPNPGFHRPYAGPALYSVLFGAAMHAISHMGARNEATPQGGALQDVTRNGGTPQGGALQDVTRTKRRHP